MRFCYDIANIAATRQMVKMGEYVFILYATDLFRNCWFGKLSRE